MQRETPSRTFKIIKQQYYEEKIHPTLVAGIFQEQQNQIQALQNQSKEKLTQMDTLQKQWSQLLASNETLGVEMNDRIPSRD